jgi:ribose 5-phosphate isomerase B
MKLVIGSDHAGVHLKELIQKTFSDIEFIDVGTHGIESCDYPDYISLVAQQILSGSVEKGIAICGTGIGASIVANKFPGIRAALCSNCFMAEMSRRHNNSNVLVLGARVLGEDLAIRIVQTWLSSPYEGGRHQRRLDKIADIERSCSK